MLTKGLQFQLLNMSEIVKAIKGYIIKKNKHITMTERESIVFYLFDQIYRRLMTK